MALILLILDAISGRILKLRADNCKIRALCRSSATGCWACVVVFPELGYATEQSSRRCAAHDDDDDATSRRRSRHAQDCCRLLRRSTTTAPVQEPSQLLCQLLGNGLLAPQAHIQINPLLQCKPVGCVARIARARARVQVPALCVCFACGLGEPCAGHVLAAVAAPLPPPLRLTWALIKPLWGE